MKKVRFFLHNNINYQNYIYKMEKYKGMTSKQIKSCKRNFIIMYFIGVHACIQKFYPMFRYWRFKSCLQNIDLEICNLLSDLQSKQCKKNYDLYFNSEKDGSSKSD